MAWSQMPPDPTRPSFDAQYRPAYFLAQHIGGKDPYWRIDTDLGSWSTSVPCIASTSSGPELRYIERVGEDWVCAITGDSILAAGYPFWTTNHESFGLFAPVVTRHSEVVRILPVEDLPLIDVESAVRVHNANETCGNGIIHLPLESRVNVHAFAAVHDSLFLLTFVSWLISLISIPKWTLWHRLTPAQRRRARGCCPRCNYNLEGLSSPTCPECGNHLASPAVP